MGLKLKSTGGTGSVELKAPDNHNPDTTITLPADNVTGGEFVLADGSGNIDLGPLDIDGGASDDSVNIDSSGRLLVGTSTARSNIYVGSGNFPSVTQTEGSGSTYNTGLSLLHYSSAGYAPVLTLGTSASNTAGTNTVTANGSDLGIINFVGNDGTNFRSGAYILATRDAAPGTGMPGRLVFSTTANGGYSPTEKMRITSAGFLKASDSTTYVSATGSFHEMANSVAGQDVIRFTQRASSNPYGVIIEFPFIAPDNNSNYFLNCVDSAALRTRIYSDGDVWTSDAGTLSSDATLKHDITDASPKLADVMNLKVRNFYWNEDYHPNKQDKKLIGFIAQEFEEVFPGLVSEHKIKGGDLILDEDGNETGETTPEVYKKGIKEGKLIPILVKAFQEAVDRIETLEATNTAQAATIADLDARLTALEGGTTE